MKNDDIITQQITFIDTQLCELYDRILQQLTKHLNPVQLSCYVGENYFPEIKAFNIANAWNKVNKLRQRRQQQVVRILDPVLQNRHRFLPDSILILMLKIGSVIDSEVQHKKLSKVFMDNEVISIKDDVVIRSELYHKLTRVIDKSKQFEFELGDTVLHKSNLYKVVDILSQQNDGGSLLVLKHLIDKNLKCFNTTVAVSEMECVLSNVNYKNVLAEHSNAVRTLVIEHSEALLKLKTDMSNRIFNSIKA